MHGAVYRPNVSLVAVEEPLCDADIDQQHFAQPARSAVDARTEVSYG